MSFTSLGRGCEVSGKQQKIVGVKLRSVWFEKPRWSASDMEK